MRIPSSLLLLTCSLAVGCSTPKPSPFKDLGGDLSDAKILATLKARTDVKSFYAVLSMAYEGPDREATFDAVMHYLAPETYRFTAFKDLILATADVFDLVIKPDGYAVRYTPEGADEPSVFRGQTENLATDHPRFRGFLWAGEAFFLPGSIAGAPRIVQHFDGIDVLGRLANGVAVRWEADSDTLEVYTAVISPPSGEALHLSYFDYSRNKGRFFPGRIRFRDPSADTLIIATPIEYEVNPKLDAAVFELDE